MSDMVDPIPTWGIVELLGHRRLAGFVTTASVAGVPFLEVNVPEPASGTFVVQLMPPASVYAITPTSEETAQAAAANAEYRPSPISRWEVAVDVNEDRVANWLLKEGRLKRALGLLRETDWIPTDDAANAEKLAERIRTIDLPF